MTYAAERFADREFLLLLEYIRAFLAKNGFIVESADPQYMMRLCQQMFMVQRVSIRTVKWPREHGSDSGLRFATLRTSLESRLSPLDPASAVRILRFASDALDCNDYVERWQHDVAWHFARSSSDPVKGRVITDVIRQWRPRHCLELGTAYGIGTSYIALAQERFVSGGRLWTIEGSDTQYQFSAPRLAGAYGENVTALHGRTDILVPELADHGFDFVFHDAGHSFEAYTEDFQHMLPGLQEGAVVLFDDIRWQGSAVTGRSSGCYEGWITVTNHPRVVMAFEINGSYGVALIGPVADPGRPSAARG